MAAEPGQEGEEHIAESQGPGGPRPEADLGQSVGFIYRLPGRPAVELRPRPQAHE